MEDPVDRFVLELLREKAEAELRKSPTDQLLKFMGSDLLKQCCIGPLWPAMMELAVREIGIDENTMSQDEVYEGLAANGKGPWLLPLMDKITDEMKRVAKSFVDHCIEKHSDGKSCKDHPESGEDYVPSEEECQDAKDTRTEAGKE